MLALVTKGYKNQQIAEELYLSINSIKSYIRSTYRKLGVDSRSQAVAWAIKAGFITSAPEVGHAE
ncbi:Regulatory protein, LuxR (fragment) [metagenome]|uniref:Regulatory protein, LuxR n=1 Tax=metagenome TaxID=256318 RepID=A0A2P2BY36_9ZZZZ